MADHCGAKTRDGGHCKRVAGWGTESRHGRCRLHGGATPNGRLFAAKQEASVIAAQLGASIEMDPGEALLSCVHLDAGEVAFLQHRVQLIEEGKQLEEGHLHPTVRAFQMARDQLARHSKLALDAGIDERRVQLVESMGQQLGAVLRNVIEDVDLSPSQQSQLREAMTRHLSTLGVIDQRPRELSA
jgi:hypothetical protein